MKRQGVDVSSNAVKSRHLDFDVVRALGSTCQDRTAARNEMWNDGPGPMAAHSMYTGASNSATNI
jgi:hypothetical protein